MNLTLVKNSGEKLFATEVTQIVSAVNSKLDADAKASEAEGIAGNDGTKYIVSSVLKAVLNQLITLGILKGEPGLSITGPQGIPGESVDVNAQEIVVGQSDQLVFVTSGITNIPADRVLVIANGKFENFTKSGDNITLTDIAARTGNVRVLAFDAPAITALEIMQNYIMTSVLGGFEEQTDSAYSIVDLQGNEVFRIDLDGAIHAKKINVENVNDIDLEELADRDKINTESSSANLLEVADPVGNILFTITDLGTIETAKKWPRFGAEINYFIVDGQSNSLNVGSTATLNSVGDEPGVIMMKKGATRSTVLSDFDPNGTEVYDNEFVPQFEESFQTNNSSLGRVIKQLLETDGFDIDEADYKILLGSPGLSGTPITGLAKGTTSYQRFLNSVINANRIANLQNSRLDVPAIAWLQGESDRWANMSVQTYLQYLEQLRKDKTGDIKAVTGQTFNPVFFLYQISNFGERNVVGEVDRYAYAQMVLDLAILSPEAYCLAGPTYQFSYASDSVHFETNGHNEMGAMYGYVMKKRAIDGIRFLPLHIQKASFFGNKIYLDYHVPAGKLKLDTVKVSNPGNYGFKLYNAAGVEKDIAGVSVISPTRVKIVAQANAATGDYVTYAQNNFTAGKSGPTQGTRGNLRDTQGETVLYGSIPINNWAVIQKISL